MEDIINSKGKKWQGFWEQGTNKGAMTFEKFFIENGIVKGAGVDEVGTFEIDGKIEGEKVQFDKQYIRKHNVIYIGTYDGRVISGKWHIGRSNDNFKIWRADVSPWKGVFYQQGQAHIMTLELGVESGMIQGTGEDYLGPFTISGSVDEKNKIILKKEYLGEATFKLEGEMIDEVQIKGTYQSPNGICMYVIEKCPAEKYEEVLQNIRQKK